MSTTTAIRKTGTPATADHEPGRSDGERARALVERLRSDGGRSIAEILHELRQAFPNSPLSVRIAALAALGRRGRL
jgi:hypothetical protein